MLETNFFSSESLSFATFTCIEVFTKGSISRLPLVMIFKGIKMGNLEFFPQLFKKTISFNIVLYISYASISVRNKIHEESVDPNFF